MEVEENADIDFYYQKSFMPALTISVVPSINSAFPRGGIPAQMTETGHFRFYEGDGGSSGSYYPVVYRNEFWNTAEKMVIVNKTLAGTTLPLRIEYNTLGMWKWQMMAR